MGYAVEQKDVHLLVRIDGGTRSEQQIVDAVSACGSRSWWSCPSGECAKVAAWDTRCEQGTIVLTLTPRSGEALSAAGIGECLRYVLDETASLGQGN